MRKSVKPSILLLTAVFVAVDIFGAFVLVQPARAQIGGPTTIVADIPRKVSEVKKDVTLGIKETLTISAMGALMNGLSYFTRKLAYDTANYVASGGSGQSALVFKQGISEYLGNAGLDAVGEAIGTIGQPFGISLCQGLDPEFNINLAINLRNLYSSGRLGTSGVPSGAGGTSGASRASAGPTPKCQWQELKDSWGNLDEKFGAGTSAFTGEIFTNSFNISESDLGITMGAIRAVDNANSAAQEAANLERIIGQGFKDVLSPISGRVKTPASQVRKELEGLSASEQQKLTAGQIAGIYGSSLQSLPYMAANVFLNTLTSELLKNVMTGLFDDDPNSGNLASGVGSFFASTLQDNRKSAERSLRFLISATVKQLDNYNVVADFVAERVIDNGFQQAIDGGNNRALTITQAIESNYLHSNWSLIPPVHAWNSSVDNDCYIKAYCYSNIQKLRKARILPIGFELAALKSDPDSPWSLGDVVSGFSDCNQFGEADDNHPYCHLIDPNWVIKSPQARCQAEVIGPELLEKTIPTRKAECADLQTCVSEESDGTCNAWGYCTKEENVWRLGGEECPDYYSTCTTYSNTANGASNSFLSRTLDFGECTEKSVGCSAYSSEKVGDEWVTTITTDTGFKIAGREQTLFFNNKVETCSASSEGCSVFYGAQRNPATGLFTKNNDKYIRNSADIINLQKAPDYLHCYDIDPSTEYTVEWPQTVSQVLNDLPDNLECGNFARACAPTEVGCSKFTSVNTGDDVSAIVSIENSCSSECVGYETFKQEASNFEGEEFPLYFIPRLGQSCLAQSTGCDEFTNLETSAEGENLEYYNYLRSCLKPEETDEKIFLSWEGSNNEGYVLRNHRLATVDANDATYINGLNLAYIGTPIEIPSVVFPEGSPAYGDNTKDQLQKNYNLCNETAYNILINNIFDPDAASPDCRQFYDNEGNIYYRLLADTVIVSEQCKELRKTESNLFVDANITDQSSCEDVADGFWDASASICNRCYGGGQYESGTCFYRSLTEESSQCSAVYSGCRAYTGNTGNNLRPNVILDGFEGSPSEALSVWSTGSISAEALQSAQHSLRVTGGTIERTISVGTIDSDSSLYSGAWYELSFWARGIPQNLVITFEQAGAQVGLFTADVLDPTTPSFVTIGNSWKEYTLGPVQFDGNRGEDLTLKFESLGGSSDYYMDNVRLAQLEDNVFLVKDSWKQLVTINNENVVIDAPLACFGNNVNPEGLLPGSALGCSEYNDEKNNTYYITGFSSLCREDAIGCQPVYDSNNTPGDILPRVYNAICNGTSGLCEINIGGKVIGSCNIPAGQTKCYVEEMTLPINDNGTPDDFSDDEYILLDALSGNQVDLSTVYIPPESGDPIFLTNRGDFQCSELEVGCTKLGLQDHVIPDQNSGSYQYSDIYIKNNPNNYSNTLCRQELVGCNEYSTGANKFYFKDPAETGNAICVYKDNVGQFSGWFKKDVGICDGADTYCRSDNDCGGNKCNDIGSVPCYNNFLQNGDSYGIWSNSSVAYEGFVGQCETKYNACTQLVDPQDTSSINPDGRSYYRIYDDKLTSRVSECNGQVSLKEGCVLFDKADQPNKFYNSKDTYALSGSDGSGYGLVNPVISSDSANPNDSNLILKVDRDRECSEWLACRDKIIRTDENGNKQILCTKYEACNAFRQGEGTEGCSNFIGSSVSSEFLDEEEYISRDVSWYGYDYSGYSLLNKYQISSYSYLSFSDDDVFQYLGANIPIPSYLSNTCVSGGFTDTNGNVCGPLGNGRCFAEECLYKIDGASFEEYDFDGLVEDEEIMAEKINKMRESLTPASCKSYPEEDSPFPRKISDDISELISVPGSYLKVNENVPEKSRINFTVSNNFFKNVNVCQDGLDCSCEYKKYVYGDVTDYYSTTSTATISAPIGVCSGGDKGGEPCERDIDCQVKDGGEIISSGSCSKLKEIQTHIGLRGFCLEPDLSRPINGKAGFGEKQEYACQTWLPIQTSASNIDLLNMNLAAGYDPSLDANPSLNSGELYCASTHRGGIVDPSFDAGTNFVNRLQAEAQNDDFTNTYIDQIFDEPMPHFNCTLYDDKTTADNSFNFNYAEVWKPGTPGVYWDVFKDLTRDDDYIFDFLPVDPMIYLRIPTFESVSDNANGSLYYYLMCSGCADNLGYGGGDCRDDYGFYIYPDQPDDNNYGDNNNSSSAARAAIIESWKPFMYKLLSSFAWNRIGNNSVLLRAEYHPNKDLTPGDLDHKQRFAPWVGGSESDQDFEVDHGAFDKYYHDPDFSDNADPTKYKGLYIFDNATDFINEDSVKDMYFIPVTYKGTVRGGLPKTINDLANPTIPTEKSDWDNEVLRLPIKELKTGNGILNGSIDPIRSVVIDKDQGDGSGALEDQGEKIINFSITKGDSNGQIIPGMISPNSEMDGVPIYSGSEFSKNLLLTWKYKINREDHPEFFYGDEPGDITTKYVLVFFGNNTGPRGYNYGSSDLLNVVAPVFITDKLGFGGAPGPFVPSDRDLNDPFTAECQTGYVDYNTEAAEDPHYNPWWAVAVNFGANGEFKGYTTRWCRGYNSRATGAEDENAELGAGISFAVIADMANQCSEYVKVHDSDNSSTGKTLNKAWTNRVWRGAVNSDGTPLNHPLRDYGIYGNFVKPMIDRDFAQQPFGSLRLSESVLDSLENDELTEYSFEDRTTDGIPYSCRYFSSLSGFSSILVGYQTNSCAFDKDSNYREVASGYNANEMMLLLTSKSSLYAQDALFELFAYQFTRAEINPQAQNYLDSSLPADVMDRSDILYGRHLVLRENHDVFIDHDTPPVLPEVAEKYEYLRPPAVFSVNPILCSEENLLETGEPCVAAEYDNITVNGRTGVLNDYDNDLILSSEERQKEEDHIAIGSFTANVKFFAFADDNRMPIRKVSVHWGDNSTQPISNEFKYGYYKNSKPFCTSDPNGDEVIPVCRRSFEKDVIPSSLTCQKNFDCPDNFMDVHITSKELESGLEAPAGPSVDRTQECVSVNKLREDPLYSLFTYDTPRFGNAPRACTTEPFEFEHIYSCSVSTANFTISDLSTQTKANLASAGYNDPAQPVCVFKPRVQVIDNWGYCNGWCVDNDAGPEKGGNYCYTPDPKSSEGECAWPSDFSTTDRDHAPWTEYKGNIVIIPTT